MMISQMYAVKVKTGNSAEFILQDVCNVEEADYHPHMPHLCTNASVFFIGIRPRVKNKEWIHKTEIWQWHLTKQQTIYEKNYTQ